MFRHITHPDHNWTLVRAPIARLSFRPSMCTLDDTSIAEVDPSKTKLRRGTGKELERSALRVNRVGRKSKEKDRIRTRSEEKEHDHALGDKSR